jgi:hypothetical protein
VGPAEGASAPEHETAPAIATGANASNQTRTRQLRINDPRGGRRHVFVNCLRTDPPLEPTSNVRNEEQCKPQNGKPAGRRDARS